MSDTPRIRLVGAGEQERLREVRLAALSYSPHLADVLDREGAESARFWSDRVARGAAGVEMATLVAVDGDTSPFVGVVDGFLSDDRQTVEIGGMWVAPAVRRRGVGNALLDAACDWARGRGARSAGLWVRAENGPALVLYQRAGFAIRAGSDSATPGYRLERAL